MWTGFGSVYARTRTSKHKLGLAAQSLSKRTTAAGMKDCLPLLLPPSETAPYQLDQWPATMILEHILLLVLSSNP